MKRQKSLIVIVVLFLLLIGSNVWWAFHNLGACDRFLFRKVESPNGKLGIFLLYSNCGATAPFSTQAVLLPADKSFPRSGYRPFLVVRGLHELQVHWRNNGAVEIVLPKDTKIHRRDSSVQGVAIVYR